MFFLFVCFSFFLPSFSFVSFVEIRDVSQCCSFPTGGDEDSDPCFPGVFFRQYLPYKSSVPPSLSSQSFCLICRHVYFAKLKLIALKICFTCHMRLIIQETFDLVVSAFSLFELKSMEERLRTILHLWKRTNEFLVSCLFYISFHEVIKRKSFQFSLRSLFVSGHC